MAPFDLELFCEVVSDNHSEGGEEGSKEHADVTNVNGDIEKVHDMVEKGRGHHQS